MAFFAAGPENRGTETASSPVTLISSVDRIMLAPVNPAAAVAEADTAAFRSGIGSAGDGQERAAGRARPARVAGGAVDRRAILPQEVGCK